EAEAGDADRWLPLGRVVVPPEGAVTVPVGAEAESVRLSSLRGDGVILERRAPDRASSSVVERWAGAEVMALVSHYVKADLFTNAHAIGATGAGAPIEAIEEERDRSGLYSARLHAAIERRLQEAGAAPLEAALRSDLPPERVIGYVAAQLSTPD